MNEKYSFQEAEAQRLLFSIITDALEIGETLTQDVLAILIKSLGLTPAECGMLIDPLRSWVKEHGMPEEKIGAFTAMMQGKEMRA